MAVGVERPAERAQQRVRGLPQEAEAGAPLGVGVIVVFHRIGQPAGLAHQRQGAIAHGDHLPQSARLVAAGHQE